MTDQASNLESLIKRVGARIPTSVTPATRIEIHPSEWLELANELAEPKAPTTAQAFDVLRAAIKADLGYAWSWHCNLAMPMIDSGVADALANESAARLMQHLFGFDSRSCKEWGTHRGAGETPVAQKPISLNGHQIRAIVQFLGGEFDTEISIGYFDAVPPTEELKLGRPAGYYVWCTEYPEEGSWYLNEARAPFTCEHGVPDKTTRMCMVCLHKMLRDDPPQQVKTTVPISPADDLSAKDSLPERWP